MKKLVISLISLALFIPVVSAANISSTHFNVLDEDHVQEIHPILIEADMDHEITAMHGINILLDPDEWILWDSAPFIIEGSAVSNGRVSETAEVSFSQDYKVLHIPVNEDFLSGEVLELRGVQVRTYDDTFGSRYLELDINGDLVADAVDINSYKVGTIGRSDNTTPYPVNNAQYHIDGDTVVLEWDPPADYDIKDMRVDKWNIKNGIETYKPKIFYDDQPGYTDSNLGDAQAIRYKITAEDFVGHISEPVELYVDLTVPAPEPEEEEEEEEEEEPAAEPEETELEELSRLLHYYQIRYSIKCMPSGVAAAENDSACLWARIDLIYAQEKLGKDSVAYLSERDLELMETRRRWPELRYEANCMSVPEPASYCPALGKALDRISYFLD